MASTATDILRLDLQATGDNPNAWGVRLNQALKMIDEAAGGLTIDLTGDVTLTSNNYTSDQSRRAALRFTGAGGVKVIVPPVSKLYLIDNRCAADITIKTASNAGAVVRAGMQSVVLIDGTTTTVADPTLDKIAKAAAPVDLNGQRITNAGAAVADTDLIQRGQVAVLSSGFVDLARAWATQATGEVVVGQGYSARYHANLAAGSALSAGMSMSGASASASLAQQWAVSLDLVDSIYRGARFYALAAADSAAAAAQFDPSSYYTKAASDARYGMAGDTARALRTARFINASTFP